MNTTVKTTLSSNCLAITLDDGLRSKTSLEQDPKNIKAAFIAAASETEDILCDLLSNNVGLTVSLQPNYLDTDDYQLYTLDLS